MGKRINLEEEKELMALGKALSSEIRLKILGLLQEGPLCVNEIAELLNIPASSAALHVRVLEEAETYPHRAKAGYSGLHEAVYPSGNQCGAGFTEKIQGAEGRSDFHACRKLCGL